MNNKIIFSLTSWEQYQELQEINPKLVKKINQLIKDILSNGLSTGLGKPEQLKYKNLWSRRINSEHRLVYTTDENNNLLIVACKSHYETI